MLFRKSASLNYQKDDVAYVMIQSAGHINEIKNVKIEDPEKIREIINYINSLKIVQVKEMPEYITKNVLNGEIGHFGWISIYFGNSLPEPGNYSEPGDIIQFERNYMGTSYNGRDWEGENYYIKNSGYNNKTKSSNVYEFLRDLINKQLTTEGS